MQGIQGEIGPTGATGATGPQGEIGPTGATGADGITPIISSALASSTGTIAVDTAIPLTEEINTSPGDITIGTNSAILGSGLYLVQYNGSATDLSGLAELSIYNNGVQIPSSESSATILNTTDFATLNGSTIINATSPTVIDVRNSGTQPFGLTNLALVITKLS